MGHKVPTIDLHVAAICGSYHNPFVVSEKRKTLGARVVITGLSFSRVGTFRPWRGSEGSVGTEDGRDWSVWARERSESGEIVGPERKIKALKA